MERSTKIKITYILFSIIVFILCIIYANMSQVNSLMDENKEIIFSNLQFDHSELVTNLFNSEGYYQYRHNIKYHLAKLPVLPLIISSLALISKNLYFIYFVKNLVLFSIIFYSLNFYCKSHNRNYVYFLICLVCMFIIPHNLHVQLNIHFADTIVACLLPSLFWLISTENKEKYIYVSLILFILYLTKTSMFFLCLILPFGILILENDNIKRKILPIFSVILAVIIWGSFGLVKTGVFPFGSKILSVASEGMSVALNEKFHKYYPQKSVDLIKLNKIETNRFNTEWEIYEHYKSNNDNYLRYNLDRYIKDTFIKIKVVLFNIKKDSVFPDNEGNFKNPIKVSFLLNKIIFNLSIIIAMIILFKNINNLKLVKLEIYLLTIVGMNTLPLIAGWATAKHLTGMTLVCLVYLLIKLNNKNLKKLI